MFSDGMENNLAKHVKESEKAIGAIASPKT